VATRSRRDYYEILGVPRDADRETVRRAFRVLAAEFHPDVSDSPDALDRFREIAEAYEVLSRPETREQYDRYGFEPRGVGGFGGGQPGSPGGLFDDLLRSPGREARRGEDVLVRLELAADEAARGGTHPVRFTTVDVCDTCRGIGAAPGTTRRACPACGGRGRIREAADGSGFHLRTCGRCEGSGKQIVTPCADCDGTGRIERDRSLLVEIPANAADGDELRLAGHGDASEDAGEPGDLVLTLSVVGPDDPILGRRLAMAGLLCALGLTALVVVFLR
jgi:molecular chaperone DnaJ